MVDTPKSGKFYTKYVIVFHYFVMTTPGLIMIDVIYTSRLHEKHPWYSEQLTFLMVNTDNNAYLTKDEFFEAAKVSPDMQVLNFSYKQLENLVDGLIAIGDQVIIYVYLNPSIPHHLKIIITKMS